MDQVGRKQLTTACEDCGSESIITLFSPYFILIIEDNIVGLMVNQKQRLIIASLSDVDKLTILHYDTYFFLPCVQKYIFKKH